MIIFCKNFFFNKIKRFFNIYPKLICKTTSPEKQITNTIYKNLFVFLNKFFTLLFRFIPQMLRHLD